MSIIVPGKRSQYRWLQISICNHLYWFFLRSRLGKKWGELESIRPNHGWLDQVLEPFACRVRKPCP
jgi:hypothetical protein